MTPLKNETARSQRMEARAQVILARRAAMTTEERKREDAPLNYPRTDLLPAPIVVTSSQKILERCGLMR